MSTQSSTSCCNGYVALTFDDGPDLASTPRLRTALRRAGLRATFFDIAQRVADYPQLTRRTVAYGNPVEDHTWDPPLAHRRINQNANADGTTGDQRTRPPKQTIVSATGLRPQFVRSPYGDTSPAVQQLADQLGLIEVGWTVDSTDDAGNLDPAADRNSAIRAVMR